MSERLTPGEQREIRAALGSEIGVSDPMERTIDFMSAALGVPLTLTVQDKLRGKIAEACYWIRQNHPGKALDVLEEALKL